jgi:hypothetical protein
VRCSRVPLWFFLSCLLAVATPVVATSPPWRQYGHQLTSDEREQISYIVVTLSEKKESRIILRALSLKRVGDKVNHVHPLRFLEAIFIDEKLKAGVHNIRYNKDAWVWDRFVDGIRTSLDEENKKGNLTDAQLADFANVVGIDVALIRDPVHKCQWDEFVQILLDRIPRNGNISRYDM